jgi:rhamnose transport system ATP-binding protein
MTESLLRLRGIHKRYGPTHALKGVDLDLNRGEVLALVGENGAGKSTMVKILTGVIQPDEGEIALAGQVQGFANAHAENVYIGRHLQRGPFIDWAAMNTQAQAVLDEIGARFKSTTLVKDLSLAERHLVEIARALSQKASVVILDEPTAALSQQEIRDFYGLVRKLRAQGVGVIFITHKFDEIFAVADRYLVLRDGASVGQGLIADATEQELVRLMAGRAIEQIYPAVRAVPGEVVLKVQNLSHPTEFDQLSFTLRRGEILGFYGLVGSGRSVKDS